MPKSEYTFRTPLDSTGDNGKPEFLMVSVDHQAGGTSFLNGAHSERGVYASFTVCFGDIADMSCTAFTLFDKRAGKLLLAPTGRKSPKKIALYGERARAQVDALKALWLARDWPGILTLLDAETAPASV